MNPFFWTQVPARDLAEFLKNLPSFQTWPGWVMVFLVLAGAALVLILFAAFVGGILTYFERRVAARIQYRVGPNRVGPQGILQFLADGVKLVLKEDLIPKAADQRLFRLAPYLVVMGTFLAFVALPFSPLIILADLNVGILFILAVSSFVVIGIIMSGWASNSKWSLYGALRSAAQIVSYEIPTGLAVLNVVLLTGTLSMQQTIQDQGPWPWQWNMFANPFLFVAAFVYFWAALAEINRTPFDIPEAESELVSGYVTEYSGIRFGFFFVAEFANVFLISAICTTLFLGGWQVPAFVASGIENPLWLNLVQLLVFFIKTSVLVFLILQLRWTLPRLRVDQLMTTCWKYLVPIAFVNIVGTAFYMVFWPQGILWVSFALFLIMAYVVFGYIRHVVQNLRNLKGQLRFNPFS